MDTVLGKMMQSLKGPDEGVGSRIQETRSLLPGKEEKMIYISCPITAVDISRHKINRYVGH
jgi:hypothetical protein